MLRSLNYFEYGETMSTEKLPAGAPCWIDLLTSDPAGARDFYNALFGWTYETGDEELYGGYTMAFKDGRSAAGMMKKNADDAGYPDMWSVYLRSDDIEATVAAASQNGGVVYMAPMEVPEQGKMAMIGDSAGASIGVWEFGGHTGFQAIAEVGAAAWFENMSKDYPASLDFYRSVFNWELTAMPGGDDFKYSTMSAGADPMAGIMDASGFLPEQVPSFWQVYFCVENTDDSVEKAVSLGATLTQPTEDTPFGRMAGLTDPTGAAFRLIQDQPNG